MNAKEREIPVLYSVTMIDPGDKDDDRSRDSRTVAICTALDRAQRMLEADNCMFHGLIHDFAVITTIVPDLEYAFHDSIYREWWYRWKQGWPRGGRYEPCEKPKEYERIICWGIG